VLFTPTSVARLRWSDFLSLAMLSMIVLPGLALASEVIELPQSDGSTLKLRSPAKRLVTLSPHLTELVYAAGAGDLVVATVEYSEYPPAAIEIPRVGDAFRIDTERIHLNSPDLILAWETGNPPAALAQLSSLGFAVWIIEIREVEAIARVIQQIGMAADTSALADPVSEDILLQINTLKSQNKAKEDISYFYQIAAKPLYTINGEHLISRGLKLCGGRNVFSDLPNLAPQVGMEAVLLADPSVLIGPDIEGASDPLQHWQSWSRMTAVNNGSYMLLPADAISRATPRFIDAVELACTMLDDLR